MSSPTIDANFHRSHPLHYGQPTPIARPSAVTPPLRVRTALAMNDELTRHGLRHVLSRVLDDELITELPFDFATATRLEDLHADLVIVGVERGTSLAEFSRLSTSPRVVAIIDSDDPGSCPLQLIRDGAHALIDRRTSPPELVATIVRVASGSYGLDRSCLDSLFVEIRASNDDPVASAYTCLTRREREVLTLVTDGLDNRAIASHLFVSESTVKFHVHNIMSKVGIHKRSALVAAALGRLEPSGPSTPVRT